MSEVSTMEAEEVDIDRPKRRKSKTPKKGQDDVQSKNRILKGILLSATKPYYTLQRGTGTSKSEVESLRWLNRNRLSYLLRKLMRRHNFNEAIGVLSVLLKGTCQEKSVSKNRTKYLATMELLSHIKGEINPRKLQHVYETWMKKIGTTRDLQKKDRSLVQLEFIVFCLTHGNIEDAYEAVICLMQERDIRSDPISNLVVGLTFYHMWYTAIQKEFPSMNLDEPYTPKQSKMSGSGINLSIDNSMGHDAVEVQEANFPNQHDSDTSVRNNKKVGLEEVVDQNPQLSVDMDQQGETPHQNNEQQGFYVYSAESNGSEESSYSGRAGNMPCASIFYAHGLEPWLMPLRLPNSNDNVDDFIHVQKKMRNDHYKSALKYLKLALHSTLPMYEALLPVLQMLLLGDQVKEALDEVEKFVTESDTALPLR